MLDRRLGRLKLAFDDHEMTFEELGEFFEIHMSTLLVDKLVSIVTVLDIFLDQAGDLGIVSDFHQPRVTDFPKVVVSMQ